MSSAFEIVERLQRVVPDGVLLGARFITPGDEGRLTHEELAPLRGAVLKVRRQSGAARTVARALLSRLGVAHAVLPRNAAGAPDWPAGVVGSLSHDAVVAVAAVGLRARFFSLGIDVEPPEPLSEELVHLIATAREKELLGGDGLRARLLFCVKEAVFKATHPLDGKFLGAEDIEVDFMRSSARTAHGMSVRFHTATEPRVLACVAIPA